MEKKVIVECTKKGCPRKIKIPFDEKSMPKGTVRILNTCEWHDDGDFSYESYYDKDNNEIIFI